MNCDYASVRVAGRAAPAERSGLAIKYASAARRPIRSDGAFQYIITEHVYGGLGRRVGSDRVVTVAADMEHADSATAHHLAP